MSHLGIFYGFANIRDILSENFHIQSFSDRLDGRVAIAV